MANGCGGGLGRSVGGSKCEHTHERKWSWRRPLEHIFWVSFHDLTRGRGGMERLGNLLGFISAKNWPCSVPVDTRQFGSRAGLVCGRTEGPKG